MKQKIIEEIKQKHIKADVSISLFFICVDTIFCISCLILLGCDIKNLFSSKQLLLYIIIIDILARIILIYFNQFDYSLLNEICFTLLATFQFFLLNKLFKRIFRDDYYDGRESLEIKSPYFFAFIFFFLAFGFNISRAFSIIQYIITIVGIFVYTCYIQSRVSFIIENLERKQINVTCRRVSENLSYLIAMYFVIFYGFKIINLFIENKLYYSYILMAGDVFKEGGKFLVFTLIILLLLSFYKYTNDDDEDKDIY